MFETMGLIIILILASIYVIKHIRHTMIVGEDDNNCGHCPAKEITTKISKHS